MKKIICTLAIVLVCFNIYCQQITRSVISSAGEYSTDNIVSVNWTIGQIFGEVPAEGNHFTEGFQQGNPHARPSKTQKTPRFLSTKSLVTETQNSKKMHDLNLLVFPNPTANHLLLIFGNVGKAPITATIFDNNGRPLYQQNITMEKGKEVYINYVEKLSSGSYFITLKDENQTVTTRNFVKI